MVGYLTPDGDYISGAFGEDDVIAAQTHFSNMYSTGSNLSARYYNDKLGRHDKWARKVYENVDRVRMPGVIRPRS